MQQLDFDRLDAEQQFRIHRIIASMTDRHNDDSPEQVAARLALEPTVWLAFLSRSEPTIRQTAAHRLEGLLTEPISVDPAADPDSQKNQREQLRLRLEE